jgi:hypothetical protein
MAIPKGLAAKARLKMDDGEKVYIEVRLGSPFCHFYTLYAVRGRKRKPLISRNRNVAEDGIEQLVEALVRHYRKYTARNVLETKIWIYRKRLYRKLLDADPSDLGLTRVRRRDFEYRRIPLRFLPTSYTPLQRRWEIITGKR